MLTASILKVFYWPGSHFDQALLIQAVVMIVVQCLLLKVALDNRPGPLHPQGIEMRAVGSKVAEGNTPRGTNFDSRGSGSSWRPYNFWRWPQQQTYWNFIMAFSTGLFALHVFLQPSLTNAQFYTSMLGALGLGIEAVLPIPQILTNYSSQSCRGFRLSVLANWLFGDAMKMAFFFLSPPGKVPWAFKACGVFQACCDLGLGVQYWMYGEGIVEDGGHLA